MELQSQGERGDNGNEVDSRREMKRMGGGERESERGKAEGGEKYGEGERGRVKKTEGQRGRGLFTQLREASGF